MTVCSRCGIDLPGFGVIYGLVVSHLVDGEVEELIFCYVGGCREVVLDGLVNDTTSPLHCSDDGAALPSRSVESALLATDLDPDGDGARFLQFCYAGGSRDRLIANGRTT